MDAADQAVSHRRREVGGQQERVAHRQRPVAGLDFVAVGQLDGAELVAWLLRQQLDQGHVADLVDADEHGVVQDAVRPGRSPWSDPCRLTTWKLVRA